MVVGTISLVPGLPLENGMTDEATNLRLVRSEEGGQPLLAEARPGGRAPRRALRW